MHLRSIAYVMGTLMLVTGVSMLFPALCSVYYGEDDLFAILLSFGLTTAWGLPMWWGFRKYQDISTKDAFVIAVLGWMLISAFSALPFYIYGTTTFTDGFFEMMSGYTTSGATILTDIEAVPHGLLFWRSETHLLGGMGFLTLTIIFLPHGMGGVRIFRAESSPGQNPVGERILPRNRNAMILLWGLYLGLNAIHMVLLWLGGMSWFDAICHAFGALSTSGYSTKNLSVGYYNSAWIDWSTTLFMFLGGMSFVLILHLLRGDWRTVVRNTEFQWYVYLTLFFCVGVAWILWAKGTYGPVDALRYSAFQINSLLTTTGFTTADYEQWPHAAQMVLYAVFFIGGCAGSTTSGIKIVHYVIIWQFMIKNIKKIFFSPMSIVSVRLNGQPIDNRLVNWAICYFLVNIFLILAGGCFVSLTDDLDLTSSMSAVIATLMNIGPGMGKVGPAQNYAFLSDTAKWFLSYMMLVGRLEMFSALVVFYPAFWKK
ncbi:TrkH family potassium uptake protein [Desulfovibrio ferrophilus]|uniref:Trk-type K+ transport system, membrane component n=1 Tax=Desulfovibrio ferrophilus TaxID=241368 RepID=A0A2Z6AWD6_9BACT|nr:TrkH family potassium uptake protein [Desulfovibrio ferrophilus]BBD07559.1 Trk-type K+ transport system, membrane component [Desulfovibrio ferrophilus]